MQFIWNYHMQITGHPNSRRSYLSSDQLCLFSFIYWFIGEFKMLETLCNSFSKLKEIQILFSNLKLGCFSLPKI